MVQPTEFEEFARVLLDELHGARLDLETALAKAQSAIVIWLGGGPPHLDTFDPKPEAPVRIRGEFRAIDTAVTGIQISEHFPRFAKQMKHAAILRGIT